MLKGSKNTDAQYVWSKFSTLHRGCCLATITFQTQITPTAATTLSLETSARGMYSWDEVCHPQLWIIWSYKTRKGNFKQRYFKEVKLYKWKAWKTDTSLRQIFRTVRVLAHICGSWKGNQKASAKIRKCGRYIAMHRWNPSIISSHSIFSYHYHMCTKHHTTEIHQVFCIEFCEVSSICKSESLSVLWY